MLDTNGAQAREVVVRLQGVHKKFGQTEVLRGVDMEVGRGEVVAIIGRSGSGKSTALRCIDLLETIDSGTIAVCSHRVDDPDVDRKSLRLDIGIVFQSYNLFPHLTIEENVMLAPTAVKKMSRQDARALAHRVLGQVGLLEK